MSYKNYKKELMKVAISSAFFAIATYGTVIATAIHLQLI